jgi:cyclopropane fatty-acyl-phospholipid synthase-like methyltransferase
MYQSRTDVERNRIYITLKGRITARESEEAMRQIIADISSLKPSFDVVTDISEFEPVTQKETEALLKVHKVLLEKGVNRIARVVGTELKATVGKIQFERTSRESKITAENFDSIEMANRYLDG